MSSRLGTSLRKCIWSSFLGLVTRDLSTRTVTGLKLRSDLLRPCRGNAFTGVPLGFSSACHAWCGLDRGTSPLPSFLRTRRTQIIAAVRSTAHMSLAIWRLGTLINGEHSLSLSSTYHVLSFSVVAVILQSQRTRAGWKRCRSCVVSKRFGNPQHHSRRAVIQRRPICASMFWWQQFDSV